MKRPRILLTRLWPQEVVHYLAERYETTVNTPDRPLDRLALMAAMTNFNAICPTVSDHIDAGILGILAASVRILANFGAGYDQIDTVAASRAGIAVTNTPDVLTEATAELAVMLMLMVTRRAAEGERELRSKQWQGWHPTHLMGRSISGKLLGLVGFGRIAQATARLAQSLGMRIAYHSRNRRENPQGIEAQFFGDLESLLSAADIISLHCPGGAATHHLIDEGRLRLLRPSAVLTNTARGSIIDKKALADALRDKRIAGAGLDVYACEPNVRQELLELQNVVLLPHLGNATLETRIAMGMRVAANLDAFFSGHPPVDRVA